MAWGAVSATDNGRPWFCRGVASLVASRAGPYFSDDGEIAPKYRDAIRFGKRAISPGDGSAVSTSGDATLLALGPWGGPYSVYRKGTSTKKEVEMGETRNLERGVDVGPRRNNAGNRYRIEELEVQKCPTDNALRPTPPRELCLEVEGGTIVHSCYAASHPAMAHRLTNPDAIPEAPLRPSWVRQIRDLDRK